MIEWLRLLVGMGIALGLVLTGFGWLAQWWPALDLVNNALPALAAATIVLFLLALVTRDWRQSPWPGCWWRSMSVSSSQGCMAPPPKQRPTPSGSCAS
jgi:hypothetical protein